MNKDLIETPRFNFFIGDEVLLKGKIVGFDVDENKCVENVVRLEYGQTLNVPNNNIYITDDIVDKSKIKVVVPQCVAEYIEFKKKNNFHVYGAMRVIEDHYDKNVPDWFYENNIEKFCLAWLNGYEVEKEKRYFVKIKGNIKGNMLVYGELLKRYFFTKNFSLDNVIYSHTRKELEDANFGWVFDCPGIEIEEVE
ncbi:TPA: DUF1642 domain-containing protein [Streptococcus pneumoniae]